MWIQNNLSNASQDYNDYQFSMGCGVLLSSLFIFIVYCLFEKNAPKMYPNAILPGFLSGLMWTIANVCSNLSTDSLGMTITTPITACGPNAVAFIVALFYKEVRGRKNLILLFLGFSIALAGSIVCGWSL